MWFGQSMTMPAHFSRPSNATAEFNFEGARWRNYIIIIYGKAS
jgi:hypothetical protein